ncbi:MAG: choline dehydrogenase [Alphaproteobacteria bacterium]|nr:choline dehydrogenase [Alphaproteobacteria bacterium]
MLADDRDMLRMVDAVKRLAVLTVQPALAGIADWIRLTDTDLTLPQAAALPDHELEALLRRDTGDIQHAAGSCRMTDFNDADGVGQSRWHREGHRRSARSRRIDHAVRLPGQHRLHDGGDRRGDCADDQAQAGIANGWCRHDVLMKMRAW